MIRLINIVTISTLFSSPLLYIDGRNLAAHQGVKSLITSSQFQIKNPVSLLTIGKAGEKATEAYKVTKPIFIKKIEVDNDSIIGFWLTDGKSVEDRSAPLFRKEFSYEKELVSARLNVVSQGIHYIEINGNRISNEFLNPVFTKFDTRLLANSYNVTKLLRYGKNACGVILGNGWFNHQPVTTWRYDKASWRDRPSFIMELKLTFSDGTIQVIQSDQSWKISESPYTFNSIYLGESYDQRLEYKNWSSAGFNDGNWANSLVKDPPSTKITYQDIEPIRILDTLEVVSLNQFSTRRYVAKFERNIAGITAIKLFGFEGQKIYLKHGEKLDEDGHVFTDNLAQHYLNPKKDEIFQTDVLTLNGRDTLNFYSKFGYKGFQYVEIDSEFPFHLESKDLTAFALASDVTSVSTFQTSDTIINQIWQATNNSILSNLMGFPTDCPTREKNGWTGDGHLISEAAMFNFNVNKTFSKWMIDHRDAQLKNGEMPMIIPTPDWGYQNSQFDWTVSTVFIPWNLYKFYGNRKVLEDNYSSMKSYIDLWVSRSKNGLISTGIGDWKSPTKNASIGLTSSVYFYHALKIMSEVAEILQVREDYVRYSQLADDVKVSINKEFLNVKSGLYGNGTQTEQSFAIAYDIVPAQFKDLVNQNLLERVRNDGDILSIGVQGMKTILVALCEGGFCNEALGLLSSTKNPSFATWLESGTNSLWEAWSDSNEVNGGSQNHMYFGSVSEWFFRYIGGINEDSENPGFKKFLLKPFFFDYLAHSDVSFTSVNGTISSSWHRDENGLITYTFEIPRRSTGTVIVPEEFSIVDYVSPNNDGEHLLSWQDNSFSFSSGVYSLLLTKNKIGNTFESNVATRNLGYQSEDKLFFDGESVYFKQGTHSFQVGRFIVHDLSGSTLIDMNVDVNMEGTTKIFSNQISSFGPGLYLATFSPFGHKNHFKLKFLKSYR